jgi:cellulose synthase/poly-beta-1,6-N-acetylglucosamine synthase-like glycosyltransferase
VIKERIGKAEALNQAVTLCGAEFLVLTDSRQLLSPDAIKELVCNFADEGVGVVSGELEFSDETNTVTAKGLDFYWEYEKLLRKSESKFGSCCGATGAIYAIRKNLFKPIAPDTLLDDVLIPLNIIRQGYRCVFEPAAKAFDAVAQVSSEEARRKVRTIAGNFQLFFRFPQLLAPFNNKMWLAAFSHKFLRLISPLCLLAALLSNLFLLKSLFFKFIFLGQIIFYFFAGAGYLLQRFGQKGKFFSIPYTFIFLNFITVKAFFAYLRFRPQQIWRVKNA